MPVDEANKSTPQTVERVIVRLANLHPRMEPSVLINWLKEKGEAITKGEPFYLVETRKGIFEVGSDISGVIEDLLVLRWARVKPSQEIAVLRPSLGECCTPDHNSGY